MADVSQRMQEGRKLYRQGLFRAVLFVMAAGALLSPIADVMDRWELSHGVHGTVTRASVYTKAPEHCFASGDCQLSVKVAPDGAAPFVHLMVFNRARLEHLLNDGRLRVQYVVERPARHLVAGDPLPPISWGMLGLSVLLFGVFGLSLRLK